MEVAFHESGSVGVIPIGILRLSARSCVLGMVDRMVISVLSQVMGSMKSPKGRIGTSFPSVKIAHGGCAGVAGWPWGCHLDIENEIAMAN